jgi:PAS domain S-box-containing protein
VHVAAPLPPNEQERLKSLRRLEVLDTPPEASFDRLTSAAARIFGVPVAMVSLVDSDRQWFKSKVGFDICENPRCLSFCAHAILNPGEVMVVPDATKDPRFEEHPLVIGPPYIRFYAACPLITPDGFAVGTLFILDYVPRTLSKEEVATLSDLGATVVEMLGLRQAIRRAQVQQTTRELAEAALRQSETRFRRMAENTPGVAYQFVLRPDGSFFFPYVSERCREIYGLAPEEIYRNPKIAIGKLDPADLRSFHTSVARSAKTLEPWHWEGRIHRSDSEMCWVQGISFPERLSDGDILWDGILLDITARKTAEENARHAAEHEQTILASITDAFLSLDRDWRFTYVNKRAAALLDRKPAELLGCKIWDVFPEGADSHFAREYERAIATGQPVSFEEYSSLLGCWLEVHAYPSAAGLSVYLQDVTARKKAEQELEVSHSLLLAVINGTDDAVFIKDRESRYVLMNPAGAAVLGRTPAEVIGRDNTAFLSREMALSTRQDDLEVIQTGRSRTVESADTFGGVQRVFLTTKSPYLDHDGNVRGVIGIARDVTKQRQDAVALREAKEEAERANLAKSDFLSRMSHELRTPLNAILGFGQLLELGNLAPKQHDAVEHIMRAGRHLLALIDEVLSISRIEAGRMELSLEPVEVSEVAGECLSLISRQAAERRIACPPFCVGEADCDHVLADRQRLRQVVLNFLSNAVKYNREGGQIILSCKEAPGLQWNEPRRLRIGVTDTGQGLRPEQIERLFVPFERLGAERSAIEGTGLGLALSKGLVEAMGGRMGVDSAPGRGSTFWVELSRAEDPTERMAREAGGQNGEGSPSAAVSCRGTVLYIEDNLSNLQLIEYVFENRPDLELLSVQQGTLGLEVASARRPDLILLDLHLPDLPGAELVVRLKENPQTAGIPVVVISADATPGQINRLRGIGVLDYLTKPIDVAKLLDLLDRVLCVEAQEAGV